MLNQLNQFTYRLCQHVRHTNFQRLDVSQSLIWHPKTSLWSSTLLQTSSTAILSAGVTRQFKWHSWVCTVASCSGTISTSNSRMCIPLPVIRLQWLCNSYVHLLTNINSYHSDMTHHTVIMGDFNLDWLDQSVPPRMTAWLQTTSHWNDYRLWISSWSYIHRHSTS